MFVDPFPIALDIDTRGLTPPNALFAVSVSDDAAVAFAAVKVVDNGSPVITNVPFNPAVVQPVTIIV